MPALLQAWQAIGLPGSTMLEGAGAYRTATRLSRAGLGPPIDSLRMSLLPARGYVWLRYL
jgi:hypothetical protein